MSIAFLRTHDLDKLAILFPPDPFWAARSLRLVELSNYAVETRYPGRSADKTKAKEAFALCREVRDRCRHLLNLAANP